MESKINEMSDMFAKRTEQINEYVNKAKNNLDRVNGLIKRVDTKINEYEELRREQERFEHSSLMVSDPIFRSNVLINRKNIDEQMRDCLDIKADLCQELSECKRNLFDLQQKQSELLGYQLDFCTLLNEYNGKKISAENEFILGIFHEIQEHPENIRSLLGKLNIGKN